MTRLAGQKVKLLLLERMLLEQTDEEHSLTIPQMMEQLEANGVECRDRKCMYNDMETLRRSGMDIERVHEGRHVGYYVASREFELPELKLLVDAVQSSRFITKEKTARLIRKLESLTSMYQARQLQRQVYSTNRVKTANERIYYTVDALHAAIDSGCQIRFHYYEWVRSSRGRLEMRPRRNGEWYQVSPWAMLWDNENYYLVAYDAGVEQLRHYRVDKMLDLEMLEQPRQGEALFQGQDVGAYAVSTFGMFTGEPKSLRLLVDNSLAGVIADRFGTNVITSYYDDQRFTVNVRANVSPQFFSWVFSFQGKCRILAPESVRQQYQKMLEDSILTERENL